MNERNFISNFIPFLTNAVETDILLTLNDNHLIELSVDIHEGLKAAAAKGYVAREDKSLMYNPPHRRRAQLSTGLSLLAPRKYHVRPGLWRGSLEVPVGIRSAGESDTAVSDAPQFVEFGIL